MNVVTLPCLESVVFHFYKFFQKERSIMSHGLKKSLVFGTFFSLSLLVGFVQASDRKPGMLQACLANRYVANPATALTAGLATANMLQNAMTGKGFQSPVGFTNSVDQSGSRTVGARLGAFGVRVQTPADQLQRVVDASDSSTRDVKVPASLAANVFQSELKIDGLNVSNVSVAAVTTYALYRLQQWFVNRP